MSGLNIMGFGHFRKFKKHKKLPINGFIVDAHKLKILLGILND